MKAILGTAALAVALAMMAVPANAKGCIKGAIVGGAAGHVAGHHGFLGAAAGCAIGHHEANKKDNGRAAAAAVIRRHCGLMPAALMIGHHFSISAFWKACSASGVS